MSPNKASEDRLPVLRKNLNELLGTMSTTDFAKKVGLSRQTMGFYLNGDRIPDSATLLQICQKCNVSADWLLGLSDDPSPDPCAVDSLGLSVENVNYLYDPSIALGLGCSVPEVNRLVRGFLNDILEICRDECLHSEFRIMLNIIARLNGLTKKDTHDDLLSFKDVDEYHRRNGLFVLPAKDGAAYYADKIGALIGHSLMEKYCMPQGEATVIPVDCYESGGEDGKY